MENLSNQHLCRSVAKFFNSQFSFLQFRPIGLFAVMKRTSASPNSGSRHASMWLRPGITTYVKSLNSRHIRCVLAIGRSLPPFSASTGKLIFVRSTSGFASGAPFGALRGAPSARGVRSTLRLADSQQARSLHRSVLCPPTPVFP